MPPDLRGDLTLPFYYLKSEGFWHLLSKPGKEAELSSPPKARDNALGACLDVALYELLRITESREFLRSALIETYFVPEARDALVAQGTVNNEAFRYSEQLLDHKVEQTINETLQLDEAYRPIREQGFRRAVVTAYVHRCALCEIRVQTIYGHTVVEAAHIKPWSMSYDEQTRKRHSDVPHMSLDL
jgi:putative restriction endonuclease